MMEMVNGSRFGVALMGLGIHRRSFLEAAIYAARRSQFGNRIDSYPLVRETLVDMLVDLEAGMAATYECAAAARGAQDAESGRLVRRILVPLAKMRCTRMALWAASNGPRGPRRQRLHGGLAHGPTAPRRPVPHHLGGHREHLVHRCPTRHARRTGPRRPPGPRASRRSRPASGHKVLAGALDTVAASLRDTQVAISYLETAPDDIALLQSRRFAELLADTDGGSAARRGSGVGARPQRRRPQGGCGHDAS